MRIKRGAQKNKKHKAVLQSTKGYRMSYNRLYRRAIEAALHAGQYNFAHRRHRRAQMRDQWIKIISAALAESQVSYHDFMGNLKRHNVVLDRKVLAEIAQNNPQHFKQLVTETA
ncbi:MAG: 50S ribosomal protein L20 [Candidatus Doudnabacteria bacterium]|nr:50S ribosomal protein L20 [Candidatus Doudnabacteria bacterium]